MNKPHFAPRIYHDGINIYLELADGQQVLTFPKCEGGLSKVLALIPSIAAQPGYVRDMADKLLPKIKIARKTKSARAKKSDLPEMTSELQSTLSDIVRKGK